MQPQSPIEETQVREQFQRARALPDARWQEAWRTRTAHRPATLHVHRPMDTLPISVTGTTCSLQCAHCGGHYLAHMKTLAQASEATGFTSALISGGCDPRGRVPVTDHLEEIADLKSKHRLNWHVGTIDDRELDAILPLVDAISFDLVGDRATAREVYGLDLGIDDYFYAYDRLRARTKVVPHLTLGLRGGEFSGEMAALERLADAPPQHLILIILIPTQGTAYAHVAPPDIAQVAEAFLQARVMLPTTRITLGCMRPRGAYRSAVDELAVRAGLDGIVNPMRIALDLARQQGLTIIEDRECCALS